MELLRLKVLRMHKLKVSGPLEMSVEAAVPGVVMPSPVHVFTTVEAASEYIGFRPHMPKLLPVGFNIQSVITIEKDIFTSCVRV